MFQPIPTSRSHDPPLHPLDSSLFSPKTFMSCGKRKEGWCCLLLIEHAKRRRYTSIHVRKVVPNVIQEYTLWQDKTERLRYDSPHAIRMVLNLRPLELGPWAALICPHALSLLPLHRVVIQWKLRKHKQWLTTWEYYHKISVQFYVP